MVYDNIDCRGRMVSSCEIKQCMDGKEKEDQKNLAILDDPYQVWRRAICGAARLLPANQRPSLRHHGGSFSSMTSCGQFKHKYIFDSSLGFAVCL